MGENETPVYSNTFQQQGPDAGHVRASTLPSEHKTYRYQSCSAQALRYRPRWRAEHRADRQSICSCTAGSQQSSCSSLIHYRVVLLGREGERRTNKSAKCRRENYGQYQMKMQLLPAKSNQCEDQHEGCKRLKFSAFFPYAPKVVFLVINTDNK